MHFCCFRFTQSHFSFSFSNCIIQLDRFRSQEQRHKRFQCFSFYHVFFLIFCRDIPLLFKSIRFVVPLKKIRFFKGKMSMEKGMIRQSRCISRWPLFSTIEFVSRLTCSRWVNGGCCCCYGKCSHTIAMAHSDGFYYAYVTPLFSVDNGDLCGMNVWVWL